MNGARASRGGGARPSAECAGCHAALRRKARSSPAARQRRQRGPGLKQAARRHKHRSPGGRQGKQAGGRTWLNDGCSSRRRCSSVSIFVALSSKYSSTTSATKSGLLSSCGERAGCACQRAASGGGGGLQGAQWRQPPARSHPQCPTCSCMSWRNWSSSRPSCTDCASRPWIACSTAADMVAGGSVCRYRRRLPPPPGREACRAAAALLGSGRPAECVWARASGAPSEVGKGP